MDQIADAHRIVFDEALIEQAVLLVPFVEFAVRRSSRRPPGGLPAGTPRRTPLEGPSTTSLGHASPVEILRRHRGDVHRDIAREFGELRITRDEIGLAVDLDQYADLSAGMNVTRDHPFVARRDPPSLRRGGAAFEQQRCARSGIAVRFDAAPFGNPSSGRSWLRAAL